MRCVGRMFTSPANSVRKAPGSTGHVDPQRRPRWPTTPSSLRGQISPRNRGGVHRHQTGDAAYGDHVAAARRRICGSTARVISAAAKKFSSICSRSCSRLNSSQAPATPRPAVGQHVDAAESRQRIGDRLIARGGIRDVHRQRQHAIFPALASACRRSRRRAVTTTRSPLAMAASAVALPSPTRRR